MPNEYKNFVRDMAKITDAQRVLDLHLKSLEMTLYHMFGDSDCDPYHDVVNEIEQARHNLHLRLLALTHAATNAALKCDETAPDLKGLAAREAQG